MRLLMRRSVLANGEEVPSGMRERGLERGFESERIRMTMSAAGDEGA